MTLTLEIGSETEKVLQAGARSVGRKVEDYAAVLLARAAEDAADADEADRILAETPAAGWTSWDQVKAENRL